LRMDDRGEILRLAPDVIGSLNKEPEYYQQRRLFPSTRVAKDKREKVERLSAKGLSIEEKKDDKKPNPVRFSLTKDDAAGWHLTAPVNDRLEPRARDALLAVVPDIWAEKFVTAAPEKTGLAAPERTIEVIRDDGSKVTLQIGKVSSTVSRK